MDLHEHVEIEPASLAQQHLEVVGMQCRDDQQQRVGAGRGGLVDLVGVDAEVLAQDGQVGDGPRCADVVQRPSEPVLLGQDREGGSSAACIGADDVLSRSSRADRAGRG